ncbi:hypothetical protein [Sinomicrobium soli]|uniref:hypothetical protein n=1 Tax=Sinomicrobium sp. N-1-3-6 TaxID=2219864 RepID=UPI0011BFB07D|nr:hypothetical protein [Sinomicrobium sp. N-1-3-6]
MGNTNNNNGFKVPEGYFGQLEDRLLASVSGSRRISREEGFSVPDHYLESLEKRIAERVSTDTATTPMHRNPVVRLIYTVSSVAALVAILLSVVFGTISRTGSGPDTAFTGILPEEIEYYIQNGFLSVDIQDIGDLYDSSELETVSFSSLDEAFIMEYLEEHADMDIYMGLEDE